MSRQTEIKFILVVTKVQHECTYLSLSATGMTFNSFLIPSRLV